MPSSETEKQITGGKSWPRPMDPSFQKWRFYPQEMEVLYGFIWENHGNIGVIYPVDIQNNHLV